MFNADIKEQPTDDKRRNAIRAHFVRLMEQKTLYLTPLLMEVEPFRTLGLEVLDGVTVNAGTPQYGATPVLADRLPPVRLIAITNDGKSPAYNVKGNISVRRQVTEIVPGTDIANTVTVYDGLGSDCTLSHKEARKVLVAAGWPIRDHRSKGNSRGTVVEWDWLKAESQLPTASNAVKALYQSIKAEIDQPAASPSSKTKHVQQETRP